MSTLKHEIEKHIKKLVNPLKGDNELKAVLKLKLTKKELKLLTSWSEDIASTEIQKNLSLDKERYKELSAKLIKKLNQEKIKQAICV